MSSAYLPDTTLTNLQADLLRYSVGGAIVNAEDRQSHESPLYGLYNTILSPLLFTLALGSKNNSDWFLPAPQPRIYPHTLDHHFGLNKITSATPDMGLFVTHMVSKLVTALILVELKPCNLPLSSQQEPEQGLQAFSSALLASDSRRQPALKRAVVDWEKTEGNLAILNTKLDASMTQLGVYFSVLAFKRPSDFKEKLEELKIHLIHQVKPGEEPDMKNIELDPATIIKIFHTDDTRPCFVYYNECLVQTLSGRRLAGYKPHLSKALRAALRGACNLHNVSYQKDTFFALHTADYVPDKDVLNKANSRHINRWFIEKQKAIIEAAEVMPRTPTKAQGHSYYESPPKDNKGEAIPDETNPSPGFELAPRLLGSVRMGRELTESSELE